MTTEAGTSSSKNSAHIHQHHRRLHQPNMVYPADVTSSSAFNRRRDSRETDAGGNDNVDKIISVDEFDDSDDEDTHSCSTDSPSPSDQSFKVSFSSHYSSGGTANDNSQKLRKKAGLASKVLDDQELQNLRLKINSRERKRMHDLNSALDGLREVMPYAHGPSVRKLSKIATLLLARNYILMLNSSLEEMKKLVSDIYHSPGMARRLSSQMTQLAPVSSSVVTCAGDGAGTNTCSESSATGLRCQSTTPTSKVSETFTPFAHPSTSHLSPLSTHQPAPSIIPLAIPALRASFPGLAPSEISALSSACEMTKCKGGSDHTISHTLPEHIQLLHRLQVPCACAHCLPGSSHFPPGLQLGHFSHPLFLSSAFLNRKN